MSSRLAGGGNTGLDLPSHPSWLLPSHTHLTLELSPAGVGPRSPGCHPVRLTCQARTLRQSPREGRNPPCSQGHPRSSWASSDLPACPSSKNSDSGPCRSPLPPPGRPCRPASAPGRPKAREGSPAAGGPAVPTRHFRWQRRIHAGPHVVTIMPVLQRKKLRFPAREESLRPCGARP